MLFLLIVIINTAISTIQEIHSKKVVDKLFRCLDYIFLHFSILSSSFLHSKKVVDKLSIVASPKAKVIRNGKTEIIDIHQLVLDDIIILKTG